MAGKAKILAFAGSTRNGSFNQQMVEVAAAAARDAGAEVTVIKFSDYPLPIYDADLEESKGLPENATKLKKLFLDHNGLMIASPEYNSSISPLLKNVIDWVSRPAPNEDQPLACYANKTAVLMAASPGGLGGLRGLVTVRSILGNIRVTVLPDQFALSGAGDAFDDAGNIKDESKAKQVKNLGTTLAKYLQRLE